MFSNAERRARYRARHPERAAASSAADNDRRVYVGRYYVGRAPTTQQASTLNDMARDHFAQKESL